MISRKGLFLVLVFALSCVPVFQAAHALTHIVHVDPIGAAQADSDQGHDEIDADSGADRICLECLALTAFSIFLPVLAIFFFDQMKRQRLPQLKSGRILLNFSFSYLTRAPPRA